MIKEQQVYATASFKGPTVFLVASHKAEEVLIRELRHTGATPCRHGDYVLPDGREIQVESFHRNAGWTRARNEKLVIDPEIRMLGWECFKAEHYGHAANEVVEAAATPKAWSPVGILKIDLKDVHAIITECRENLRLGYFNQGSRKAFERTIVALEELVEAQERAL